MTCRPFGTEVVEQSDLKNRIAEAEFAVALAYAHVRRQHEHLAELKRAGDDAEAARHQAILELLEDSLRRRIGNRDFLLRGCGADRSREDGC
jgi:hypothetical protein